MILQYGNFAYFFYPVIFVLLTVGLYFLLRNKPLWVRRLVVFVLILLNVFQHLFKFLVWPHITGGFSSSDTAYNMCAFLILSSMPIFICKSALWKNFITYVGTVAGMLAMLVPYWFVGKNIFTWEGGRFYFCHGVLFVTSILPSLLKLNAPQWKNWYKIGALFFLAIGCILINDVICAGAGLSGGKADLYGALYSANPVYAMHPPEAFPIMEKICAVLTPAAWENVPLLWYVIPMYVFISLVSFTLGVIFDRKGFMEAMFSVKEFLSKVKGKFSKEK